MHVDIYMNFNSQSITNQSLIYRILSSRFRILYCGSLWGSDNQRTLNNEICDNHQRSIKKIKTESKLDQRKLAHHVLLKVK